METKSLSYKQSIQFFNFTQRTASHIHRDKSPLIELMNLACVYCTRIRLMDDTKYRQSLEVELYNFGAKYYPFGFKPNRNNIEYNISVMSTMNKVRNSYPRFTAGFTPRDYKPIEKIAFIMSLRACYKYITGEISRDKFIDKLDGIRVIIK